MTIKFWKPLAWLSLAGIIFATVSPIGLRPHDFLPVDVDRAAAFTLMAILFVIAYPRHWKLAAILLIGGAGAIELMQNLSPSRHAEFHDAAIKAGGAAIGVLVGLVINLGRMVRKPV